MKKSINLCQSLGLKQQEMANLLGVSRAQWSMYECRKRKLPTAAKHLLSELLVHVETQEEKSKSKRKGDPLPDQARKEIEQMLHENEFQQTLVMKKIAAAEKQKAATNQLQHVTTFLSDAKKSGRIKSAQYNLLMLDTSKALAVDNTVVRLKLAIRQAQLKLERQMLEEQLGNKWKSL